MTSVDRRIRTLIVDDTAMYRKILSDAMRGIPEAEVVDALPSGVLALKRLESLSVDLVLLDIFMPEMDGLETLRQIRKKFPNICVVMISGATTRDASITLEALAAGALDFIAKPQVKSVQEGMQVISEALRNALRLVRLKKGLPIYDTPPVQFKITTPQPAPIKKRPLAIPPAGKFECIVIGVSTGGPNALSVLIPKLPQKIGCPILLVQHMPAMFTASLAERLKKVSKINVKEAQEGESILPDSIYIAPGGKHMVARPFFGNKEWKIGLNENPPVNSCRPAVDVLFQSVAEIASGPVLAIILTGMGDDGAAGVAVLKKKNCYCISQDEKSCVVYGMPRAVEERQLADEVLPLEQIAERMVTLTNGNRLF